MSQATSSRCPLGFLPQVLVPAAPRINSPHSALHLGVSFLEHPAHSTPSPASYRPPLLAMMAPLSADPQPLLALLLHFGFSASLTLGPWSFGSLIPGKSSLLLRMNIYHILPREYKISLLSPYIPILPPPAASQETGSIRWGLRRRKACVSLYLPVAQPHQKSQLTRSGAS